MSPYFLFAKRSVCCFVAPLFAKIFVFLLIGSASIATDELSEKALIAVPLRPIGDFRRDLKAFLKNSKQDDLELQNAGIYNLCQLHAWIVQDSRFETSEQLQGMRIVAANRLKEFVKETNRAELRENRRLKTDQSQSAETASAPKLMTTQSTENDYDSEVYNAASQSLQAMGSMGGGPAQLFNYVGNFGPPWDHGADLVDLIENTINPAFWQRNGGNGRIHYFIPLRVLVISASAQVHENTLNLLQKLR